MLASINPKQNFSELEKEILQFWQENDCFRQSIENRAHNDEFIFYDGPPFATGLPHYGHILAGTIKDVIPRFKTMQGFKVNRRFGWDCHGLPVENLIEKELNLSDKKAIEAFGEGNFNEACRSSVLRYTSEWQQIVNRMGRWVDFVNDYKTMDTEYTESVWWVFKQLWDKKLVYQGLKPMHICPRCVTPLSNFEVNLGYKDLTDFSVTVKFKCNELVNTYFLAWTTTPWTLAGNAGLAIHPDYEYVKVQDPNSLQFFILASSLLPNFSNELGIEPKVITIFLGEQLIDLKLSYEPLFPYYENKRKDGAFRLVGADFVTLDAGTGIVHIAPAFGEDDLNTGKKEGLPTIQHVHMNGHFEAGLVQFLQKLYPHFKDEPVKDKKDNRRFDTQIINILEAEKKIFKKENIKHSYPTCWRCETPLLNYATSSWFVKVESLKEQMLKNNEQIHWVPDHIKEGRFGKWLENARDWAISRTRYWGAPLPVWECNDCHHQIAVDSVQILESYTTLHNEYFFMRHGEGEHNINGIICCTPVSCDKYGLTTKGKEQVQISAIKAKELGINLIIASDLRRAKETAAIVSQEIKAEIVWHEGLREWDVGCFDDKKIADWYEAFPKNDLRRIDIGPENGESLTKLAKRMKHTLAEIESKYKNKKILIISHGSPLACLKAKLEYLDDQAMLEDQRLNTGELMQFNFNHGIITDLHKHKIDHITVNCPKCNSKMHRIPEVFDCWFESGAMPYAQNATKAKTRLPADFIAEGLDQTRGWFYTLHVLSTALFNKPAFKNCIVNGIVLAEDGEKMSKSKKNYPDPTIIFDSYGADAMRFYLMNSPVVLADDLRFAEKGVAEVVKTILLPLWNSYSFLVTYAQADGWDPAKFFKDEGAMAIKIKDIVLAKTANPLDIWIISELEILKRDLTIQMEVYNLSKATNEFAKFIDNLTNWYIRRSRRRFWDKFGIGNDTDKNNAYACLYYVLIEFAKLLAPFCPFITESIYQNLKIDKITSIHHCNWPKNDASLINQSLSATVAITQQIISLGLSLRQTLKIKVRQPLQTAEIVIPKSLDLNNHLETIKEELNVKELIFLDNPDKLAELIVKPNARILGPRFGSKVQTIITEAKNGHFVKNADGTLTVCNEILIPAEIEICYQGKTGKQVASDYGIVIALDENITPVLKQEGQARDLVRIIQEMRKEANYNVSDQIRIEIKGADEVILNFKGYIQTETLGEFGFLATSDLEKKVEEIVIKIKRII